MNRLKSWTCLRPWTRHSSVLLVAGLVFVAIGYSYIAGEATHERRRALGVALDWMPLRGWGVVFLMSGLLAILSSRWPPEAEKWGYTVLTGLSAGWGGFYLTAIMFKHAPIANGSTVLLWTLVSYLWYAISGLENPESVAVVVVTPDVRDARE